MQREPGLIQAERDAVAGDADDAEIEQRALEAHAQDAAFLVAALVDDQNLNVAHLEDAPENEGARGLTENGFIGSCQRRRGGIAFQIGCARERRIADAERIIEWRGWFRRINAMLK